MKIYIQGFLDTEMDWKASTKFLKLFVSQFDQRVDTGQKIKNLTKGNLSLNVDLTISSILLGYGEKINYIPVGYKSVIRVKGSKEDIELLKSNLEKVSGWGQSKDDFIAI